MDPNERQPCPVCGESIALTARKCRFCGEVFKSPDAAEPQSGQSANEGSSVFADTVTGVNLRWKDNLFQGVFVGISVLVCSVLGMVLAAWNPGWMLDRGAGGFVGALAGLMLGIFTSGFFLMIYRARQHLNRKRD